MVAPVTPERTVRPRFRPARQTAPCPRHCCRSDHPLPHPLSSVLPFSLCFTDLARDRRRSCRRRAEARASAAAPAASAALPDAWLQGSGERLRGNSGAREEQRAVNATGEQTRVRIRRGARMRMTLLQKTMAKALCVARGPCPEKDPIENECHPYNHMHGKHVII